MSDIERVRDAAHTVIGVTRAQIESDLFQVDGKTKNRTGETLAERWRLSGETDFGIYEGEGYLRELLYCWNCYSGPMRSASPDRALSYDLTDNRVNQVTRGVLTRLQAKGRRTSWRCDVKRCWSSSPAIETAPQTYQVGHSGDAP